jgi:hypothetical protein
MCGCESDAGCSSVIDAGQTGRSRGALIWLARSEGHPFGLAGLAGINYKVARLHTPALDVRSNAGHAACTEPPIRTSCAAAPKSNKRVPCCSRAATERGPLGERGVRSLCRAAEGSTRPAV